MLEMLGDLYDAMNIADEHLIQCVFCADKV